MELKPLTEQDVALANRIGVQTENSRLVQALYRATGKQPELFKNGPIPATVTITGDNWIQLMKEIYG